MTYIRKAPQCQCFIFLENLNEFANKSVVFLCSLLRAVFTDTHPAVLLKRAPAVATLRISQGAQFHVWVVCWRIFYSKTIFFFATALSSYGGGKRGLWRARAEGEDQTRVVHQADVSITTPDSEKTFQGEITLLLIESERAGLWESHLKTLSKTLLIVWQSIFEWSTNCTSIKDCFWFLRRTLEPSRIFWLSARLKHLIVEEGYQNNASGWLLKMTWVGRPKSLLPQRKNRRGHPHNTQDDVAEVALSHTGLCVVHWNTGYQQHHHFQ